MISFVDYFLDRITMYRLVLYYLIILVGYAFILSLFGILPYTPRAVAVSTGLLLAVCWITNKIFALIFEVPANVESLYITALILALLFTPTQSWHSFVPLGWVAVWAMASKYIFAINKKHLFNPVAIAAAIISLSIGFSASWWVGNIWMVPVVVMGGLLVVRKIKRFTLVISFFVTSLLTIFAFTLLRGGNLINMFVTVTLHSSFFFFACVMLTEPLTTPPTKKLQMVYGALVGILFAPQIHIFGVSSTPELALIVGNIFSYLVSPKKKLVLFLQQKIVASANVVDFLFVPSKRLSFSPGQYMEWTFAHPHTDSRGNRRYFTLASSPTEDTIRIGIKFYEKGSSYKHAFSAIDQKTPIIASQLAGDFTLPKDSKQKLVFIAGGIGVTPFRSMIKYLIDTKQPRSIILLYTNKNVTEIAYQDIFDAAQKQLGIKTVYTLTDRSDVPSDWQGSVGRIAKEMITKEIPDFNERFFYLSGPQTMIDATKKVLRHMGIKENHIKTDYFPGLV